MPFEDVIRDGVRGQPDINVISTRKDHEIEILIWNYHDDDVAAAPTLIDLALSGLPTQASRALLEHFRVDASHSNAFAVWKEMGSPQSPTEAQYRTIATRRPVAVAHFTRVGTDYAGRAAHLQFDLPRQGLSLIRMSWE